MAVNAGLKTLFTNSAQFLVNEMKTIEAGGMTAAKKMQSIVNIGIQLNLLSDLYNTLENVDVKLSVN